MDLSRENNLRFVICGAGAIGSVFGGMLVKAGHQVDLVGRDPHMEAVRKEGLVIDGILGNHLIRELGTYTDLAGPDPDPPAAAVFVSVKSSDTAHAVRELQRSGLVADTSLVVSLQNGLGNLELIRQAFGPDRSFGGRVIFGAQVTEPGHVHVSVWADKVLIGGPDGKTARGARALERGADLAGLLTRSGIETQVSENIDAALWGKVLYNVGLNPLSALLEVPYGALGSQENSRDLLSSLMGEAFAVAARETALPWDSFEEYLEVFFSKLLPSTESHLSSMLQDLERGRETEIDAITGQVIRRAESQGLAVPVNRVIYDLVKAKVATRERR